MNFIAVKKACNNRITRINVNLIQQYEVGSTFVNGRLVYDPELTDITLVNGKTIQVLHSEIDISTLIREERQKNVSCCSK